MESHSPSSILNPRRVLVRGVNWLGDAVMSTPALLRLRERFPQAYVTLLTPEKFADLWLHHPAINETISFVAGESLFSVSRKLRAGNFDLALVLPNSPRSALEVWLARIRQRIGSARPWRNWFLTQTVHPRASEVEMHKKSITEIETLIAGTNMDHASRLTPHVSTIRYPASAHHLHQYLHLVTALDANPELVPPQLFVTPIERAAVEKKFALDGKSTGGRPLFALNPGAEYGPAKRWPTERFIAAAREIQRRTNCVWLILGGKDDAETRRTADTLSAEQNLRPDAGSTFLNLAGKTSLRDLMALLRLCRVLLTNDTGPMHVAAALGTPVVVPFGSTSPELTGPGLPGDARLRLLKSDAPCAPCFLRECPIDFRCMKGISVERVVGAVVESLNG